IFSYRYATALELLGPGVRRADFAWPERKGCTNCPLLRLHIAGGEIVGVVLVCRPDVHHAEVVAATKRIAAVRRADVAPVLTLHGGAEGTRPAAQASPRQRGRPRARILVDVGRIWRSELCLSLVGLPSDLRLHAREERRLVEDCVVITTPQRVAQRGAPIAG